MPDHYIEPSKAAHNIAVAYCIKYLSDTNSTNPIPWDDLAGNIEMIKHASATAKIYANIFDMAFDEIINQNNLD